MRHLIPGIALILTFTNCFAANDEQLVQRLQQYIEIDTINPPGNESRGVAFLGKILEDAGISYETAESAPGRGNIWATLKGGNEPSLILLHHIDVVPAEAAYWDSLPLKAEIRDGHIYGRGAIDTKGLGIAQLHAFIALKDSGIPLNRDVIYMATADEEAGGLYGAGWLLDNRPELFENVKYLINEGGSGILQGDTPAFSIEVTQKVPLWLRLTATDTAGHGSSPRISSAVTRILRAGQRVSDTRFERRAVPAVAEYFAAIAPFQTGERQQMMAHISSAVTNEAFMLALQMDQPGRAALLSNTCSPTTMTGSGKINVVPSTAILELDCRLLPDQDPDAFLAGLKTIINDDQITIERLLSFSPAVSPTNTPLYDAIRKAVRLSFENAVFVPSVSAGFTDSHYFRDHNIVSYGFGPFLFGANEATGIHGNNERLSVENLHRGSRILTDFLFEFATD